MLKYGILINTRLVTPADEPKSWTDLTDPKWTGKILADDPRALGGGFNAFVAQHDKLGVDFLKKLADQKLMFSRDLRESERRTARGEFPVYAPFLFNDYSSLRGLPIKADRADRRRCLCAVRRLDDQERAAPERGAAVHQFPAVRRGAGDPRQRKGSAR